MSYRKSIRGSIKPRAAEIGRRVAKKAAFGTAVAIAVGYIKDAFAQGQPPLPPKSPETIIDITFEIADRAMDVVDLII
jgi:hypothetical protein